jgi:hypothetical protein
MVYDNYNGAMMELPGHTRDRPKGFPEFYKSLQHVVVSRDFVQYASYGPKTMQLLLFLANVRTADEMILPTIMQVSKHASVFDDGLCANVHCIAEQRNASENCSL